MGPPPAKRGPKQNIKGDTPVTAVTSDSSASKSSECEIDPKTEAVFRRKHYKLLNKLGAGAFGTVYKAMMTETGTFAAVKVMDLNKMSDHYKSKFLPRELETLIETKHENIIEVFDIIRANQRLYIFMEFADNGDISGYARKHDGVKLQLAAIWFLQISQGLVHLHEEVKTAHRDIKLDNFLLNSRNVAKLSDFGFARTIEESGSGQVTLSRTYCGTLPYEAPKVIRRQPYNALKADVWSMGVSLYILLHNRFPFHYKNPQTNKKDDKYMLSEMENFPRYIRSRYTDRTPNGAKELLEMMLQPDEEKRCMMRDVVANDWLQRTAH